MRIKKKELLQVLGHLRPGLAKKDITEIGLVFHFHDDHIVTYNDQVSVSIPFKTGIIGGVSADELYQILNKLSQDEVDIWSTEREFRLEDGQTKLGISLRENPYPQITIEGEWVPLPAGLMDAVELAMFTVGRDMAYPRLTCIHIIDDTVISADGYRVTQVFLSETSKFNFLLPKFVSAQLLTYTFTHFLADKNWVHFKNSETNLVLSSRQVSDEFLRVEKVFAEIEGEEITLPTELKATLSRCQLMTEAQTEIERKVDLTFKPGNLVCFGRKELGWIEEELPLDYKGNEITLGINPMFLSAVLDKTNTVIIGNGKCLFTGDGFRHVMVLVS